MKQIQHTTTAVILSLGLLGVFTGSSVEAEAFSPRDKRWSPVSGSAIHYFPNAILHSSEDTDNGKVERSTDTIDLTGDINGRIVYHVTSEFDYQASLLTNTGHQVFSGTIMGSDPVLLLDDNFIFTVDLNTGETLGKVYLLRSLAGPRIQCKLTVVGTGFDSAGNGLAEYSGLCREYKGLHPE